MSGTHVLKCSPCKGGPAADFQDKQYGKGNRVFNSNGKGASCTVCGASKHDTAYATKTKKKGGGK